MNKNTFWKFLAIVSTSLLVIIICTSSFYYSSTTTLADVCNELSNINTNLKDISRYLSKIYLEM